MTGIGFFNLGARAENIVYPLDSGVLNVKEAPFGATGNGTTDDTVAIQKAISAGLNRHKIVYFPNGTYLLSDTLRWNDGTAHHGGWGRFLSLQGQSQSRVILRLKAYAPGFTDTSHPRALIQTASGDDANRYSDLNGEGNQGFENHIRNLTVEVGRGNLGAIGIDYQVSNWGALREVTLKSRCADDGGYIGINLQRRDNGPGLIKNVTIDGFQYAVIAHQEIVQMTMEYLTLRNQRVVGIQEENSVFAIRKLTSVNRVPAVRVMGNGLLDLLESTLTGGAGMVSAIEIKDAESRALIRHLDTKGYVSAIRKQGKAVPGQKIIEYVSEVTRSLFPPRSAPLTLPVQETPTYSASGLGDWKSVGKAGGRDDSAAIQAAMNSGKSTIYFPSGDFRVSRTIRIPATVRMVLGIGSTLDITKDLKDRPVFRLIDRGTHVTIIDRLTVTNKGTVLIEQASPRTLVLRDIGNFGGEIYRAKAGAGSLFVEDVAGAGYHFVPGQRVWARQFNSEGPSNPQVVNDGADLWVLGHKTEGTLVAFRTQQGGNTEVYGSLLYTFGDSGKPAFSSEDSSMSLSFAGMTYLGPGGFYSVLIEETRGGETRLLHKGKVTARGGGVSVPLYVGIPVLPRGRPIFMQRGRPQIIKRRRSKAARSSP